MKKNIFVLSLLLFLSFFTFIGVSYAVTLPSLKVTSNNYSVGDKMSLDDKESLLVNNTLQLYAVMAHGNDMLIVGEDNLGWFVDDANLNGVTWTSSNKSVATVSDNGLVTGVSKGTVVISASYTSDGEVLTADYSLTIKENPQTGSFINIGIIGVGIIGIAYIHFKVKNNRKFNLL